jgi:ELWxxDGT repeat protein
MYDAATSVAGASRRRSGRREWAMGVRFDGATRQVRRRSILVAIAGALLIALDGAGVQAASPPTLVKDIDRAGGASPYDLTNLSGTLFFAAASHGSAYQLWRSDGTATGTQRVNRVRFVSDYLSSLTQVGRTLFFAASDGVHGDELWKSDGTASGTRMVRDIDPSSDSSPSYLVSYKHHVFFAADDGHSGPELWKSDGTAVGTKRVKDIVPGGVGSDPRDLTVSGRTLFFTAVGATGGRELWKTDGTAVGTMRVADINPTGDSFPSDLTDVGGRLFFAADDGSHGRELWKSDGTGHGTRLVKDINTTTGYGGDSIPRDLTNVKGVLFFSATDQYDNFELWKSDGSPGGTLQVKDIAPPIGSVSQSSNPDNLTNVDGVLFFEAGGPHGYELMRSDGSEGGTTEVKDIDPSGSSFPAQLAAIGGQLYFSANDGIIGRELWVSDGSQNGTRHLKDINPSGDSNPSEMTKAGGILFFAADDGTHGLELWERHL